MLNSKTRSTLRAMANGYEPLLTIGKSGVTDNVISEADILLITREMIKCRVLLNCEKSVREIAEAVSGQTNSEIVYVMGKTFVLYRKSDKEGIKHII